MNPEGKAQLSKAVSSSGTKSISEMCSDKEDRVNTKRRPVVLLERMKNCYPTTQAGPSGQDSVNFYTLSLLNHFDMSLLKASIRNKGLNSSDRRFRPSAVSDTCIVLSTSNPDNQKKDHSENANHSCSDPGVKPVDVAGCSRNSTSSPSSSSKINCINTRRSRVIKKRVKPAHQMTARAKFESTILLNEYKESMKQSRQMLNDVRRQLLRPVEEVLAQSEVRLKTYWQEMREKKKTESRPQEPRVKVQKICRPAYQKHNRNSLNNNVDVGSSTGTCRQVVAERKLNLNRLPASSDNHSTGSESLVVKRETDCRVKTEKLLNRQGSEENEIPAKLSEFTLFSMKKEPKDSSLIIKTKPAVASFSIKTLPGNSSCSIKAERIDSNFSIQTEPEDLNFSKKIEPKESHEEGMKAVTLNNAASASNDISHSLQIDTNTPFPSNEHFCECDSSKRDKQIILNFSIKTEPVDSHVQNHLGTYEGDFKGESISDGVKLTKP